MEHTERRHGVRRERCRVSRVTTQALRGDDAFAFVDLASAIGAVVVSCICWNEHGRHGGDALLLAVAVVPFLLPLIGFRVSPAFFVAIVVPCALFALGGGSVLSAVLPAMGLVYAVAQLRWRPGAAAAGAWALVYCVVAVARVEIDWVFVAIGAGSAWTAGCGFGRLDARLRDLRDAREAAAHDAVLLERRRLARELHDLVAHALTATMLSLTEIRLLYDRDRDAVLRALDDAEGLAARA